MQKTAMFQKEQMIDILYKAASDGIAKLIKNGLAFTVMSGAIAGLLWGILFVNDHASFEVAEIKQEIRMLRVEHSDQLNRMRVVEYELREEVAACNASRLADAVRIARLEEAINRMKR